MKKMVALILTFTFAFAFGFNAIAAGVQPYYVGSGAIDGTIGNSSYTVTASTTVSATRIEVSGTLHESWLFGYTQIASCSNNSNGQRCNATGTFSRKNGKKYRLDYSATFYYSNGTSETVTGSTTG